MSQAEKDANFGDLNSFVQKFCFMLGLWKENNARELSKRIQRCVTDIDNNWKENSML